MNKGEEFKWFSQVEWTKLSAHTIEWQYFLVWQRDRAVWW